MPYKDQEKRRAWETAYRAAHPEKVRARGAAYRATHVEEIRAYRAANSERERARSSAYHAAHLENERSYNAAYHAAHPEKMRANTAAYHVAHPDKMRAQSAKRRALKRSAMIGCPKESAAVYQRAHKDKNILCYLCGKLIPMGGRHVDHIVPLCKGGAHSGGNLGITCAKCNMKKGAKLPEEVGLLI